MKETKHILDKPVKKLKIHFLKHKTVSFIHKDSNLLGYFLINLCNYEGISPELIEINRFEFSKNKTLFILNLLKNDRIFNCDRSKN